MADEMWRNQALAPYATLPWASRGRLHKEAEAETRSPFQRDRDRIIHSTAFRRLKHKTQVFVYHEGDHYRTRLTHSLEVAQIARTICRTLRLDEDLGEAVALAHDLGHTPFGHAGEEALHAAMKPYGGFDHNAQTLRILTKLEERYAEFNGLNLTWETLEGAVKHNGPLLKNGRTLNELCGHLDMTRQGVTQHLVLLEAANLIATARRGREKLHFLNPVPLQDIYERWIAKFEKPRLKALADLKRRLEKTNG